MPRHVGIVGCSSEGAALCYRTLCTEAAELLGAHRHPEVSLHTPSLHLYVERLEAGDLQGVADLMLASAEKLARMGAELLICPDNTIHQAWARVQERTPLPWLHIADVVAQEARRRGGAASASWGSPARIGWCEARSIPSGCGRTGWISRGRPRRSASRSAG